jgi:hypothetical protein
VQCLTPTKGAFLPVSPLCECHGSGLRTEHSRRFGRINMDIQKPWLKSFSWEEVQNINQTLCQQQKTTFQTNDKTYAAAREIWERAATQHLSLHDVLDLCRRCFEMGPFTFNNGNTFSTVGKSLVDDWTKTLPGVEGQIIRNTVGHYIAGLIDKKELITVLRHFETSWNAYAAARQNMPVPLPLSSLPQQQAQNL